MQVAEVTPTFFMFFEVPSTHLHRLFDSGIQETFTRGIWNPKKFASGIRNQTPWNPKFRSRNPEFRKLNLLESGIH